MCEDTQCCIVGDLRASILRMTSQLSIALTEPCYVWSVSTYMFICDNMKSYCQLLCAYTKQLHVRPELDYRGSSSDTWVVQELLLCFALYMNRMAVEVKEEK